MSFVSYKDKNYSSNNVYICRCMKNQVMKIQKFTAALAAIALAVPAGAQVTYSLPRTTIGIEVEALVEDFHAGPYARYAKKYLGIDARQEDGKTFQIVSVRMLPSVEADAAARYQASSSSDTYLQLSSQGLVAVGASGETGSAWRFPARSKGDFADKELSSNLTSENATLFRGVQSDNAFSQIGVQQQMVVAKSDDQKAGEAADMIFNLRRKRVEIVTGDTDATFSGEALGAAIREIDKLEKQYLSLFTGYSDTQTQKKRFDVIPAPGASQRYIPFRISDTAGLVGPDDLSGKPYVLNLIPEELSQPKVTAKGGKGEFLYYRVPVICKVTLSDGVSVLLEDRFPVYQLGTVENIPLK